MPKIETVDGKIIVGRSELERLLGFTDKEIPEAPLELEKTPLVEPLSTDDVLLDITTITLLNFKQGYQLLQTHSLSQLIKMNEYANALQEKAQKDAEAKHSTKQHKEGKIGRVPRTTKKSSPVKMTSQMKAIADKVKKKGIPIPTINNDQDSN